MAWYDDDPPFQHDLAPKPKLPAVFCLIVEYLFATAVVFAVGYGFGLLCGYGLKAIWPLL